MMRECGIRFGFCSHARASTRKNSHRAGEFLANGRGAGEGDCLILDVHMPGMSGIELLETMRRRGHLLPTIVISGRTDAMTTNRARAAGVLAIVEKPYQPEELLCLVRRALDHG